MKTSLSKLPEYARLDLEQIVGLILENVPRCEMIILYGSYARGTQVEFDERIEFGIPTSFYERLRHIGRNRVRAMQRK